MISLLRILYFRTLRNIAISYFNSALAFSLFFTVRLPEVQVLLLIVNYFSLFPAVPGVARGVAAPRIRGPAPRPPARLPAAGRPQEQRDDGVSSPRGAALRK